MGNVETATQVSAGGVAFRREDDQVFVALISVGAANRWQLPKGRVDEGETNEAAAIREVREETGIVTGLIGLLDRIDYWFYARPHGKSVRVHKYVDFYLLRFISGDTSQHDSEVNEARWVEIGKAYELLTYESEKDILRKAGQVLQEMKSDR